MDVVTTNPLTLKESITVVYAISNLFKGWVRHFLITWPLFFSVVAECFRTIWSKMTKSFATKALDNTHVPVSWLALYCISHVNKIRDRAMLLQSGLIEGAFLFKKKKNLLRHVFKELINSQFIVHKIRSGAFKFRS